MTLVSNSARAWKAQKDELGFDQGVLVFGLYQCDECRAPALAMGVRRGAAKGNDDWLESPENNDSLDWEPAGGSRMEFEDVPEHIAAAASEAYRCHSIGAFRGAGALARAVVEAIAKDQGIEGGNLMNKIDTLESKQLVRPLIKDAAHEVRHLGNDLAHGDFVQPTSSEEVSEALEFMSEILAEVYQAPARIRRAQAARQAKQAATQTP